MQAIFQCENELCGLGGGCDELPEHGSTEWPVCHECYGKLSLLEPVEVDLEYVGAVVDEVFDLYGEQGMIELAILAHRKFGIDAGGRGFTGRTEVRPPAPGEQHGIPPS